MYILLSIEHFNNFMIKKKADSSYFCICEKVAYYGSTHSKNIHTSFKT
jgi:hypothetical protein